MAEASVPAATIQLRNPTQAIVSYFVYVQFGAAGPQAQAGSAVVYVPAVLPRQTLTRELMSDQPARTGLSCRIVRVTRFGD